MTASLLQQVIEQLVPADTDIGSRARQQIAGKPDADSDGLAELGARVAAAQHTIWPTLEHKHIVICSADHGIMSVDTLDSNATVVALAQVAGGHAAVNSVARTAGASIALIDCGVYRPPDEQERARSTLPGVIDLRVANRTADIRRGPAMKREQALASVHTGIALLLSLSAAQVDCIALGQIASGVRPVNDILIATLANIPSTMLEPSTRNIANQALAANAFDERDPIAVLAAFGGFEIGVMAGLILGAAAQRIPVVLDDSGTTAAALLAARLAPAARDYTIASHAGDGLCHKQALHELGLSPLFEIGISHGEGVGAALALPMVESAVRMLSDRAT